MVFFIVIILPRDLNEHENKLELGTTQTPLPQQSSASYKYRY
jgi:hypothetical protein